MSDLETFNELVDDIWEIVFGTKRTKTDDYPFNTEFGSGKTMEEMEKIDEENKKPKRARGLKGRYKGDDLSTAYTNEAWVGGKAPKKRRKKNVKKK